MPKRAMSWFSFQIIVTSKKTRRRLTVEHTDSDICFLGDNTSLVMMPLLTLWCMGSFCKFAVVRILVGMLDSCFLTHTKKYMTPTHMPYFFKNMPKCIFVLDILKSQCKLITLWGGRIYSNKRLAGRSFFQNTGLQGLGRVSPGRELEGSALKLFCSLF